MLVISGGGNPSPNIFSVKGHYALNVSWFYRVSWHNYRPQRSCGQGNIFTPVCHSFCSRGGVCLSACWDTHHPPQTRDPPTPPGAETPLGQTPPRTETPPGSRLQHTVYEQPVRILLECILVWYAFYYLDFITFNECLNYAIYF